MQCRVHAAQLGKLFNDFRAHNCEIILLLGNDLDRAKRYANSLHLPFPVLADPDRAIYHRYGLDKAMIFLQRTASIFVDQCGVIRYMRTTASPMPWLQEYRQLLSNIPSAECND